MFGCQSLTQQFCLLTIVILSELPHTQKQVPPNDRSFVLAKYFVTSVVIHCEQKSLAHPTHRLRLAGKWKHLLFRLTTPINYVKHPIKQTLAPPTRPIVRSLGHQPASKHLISLGHRGYLSCQSPILIDFIRSTSRKININHQHFVAFNDHPPEDNALPHRSSDAVGVRLICCYSLNTKYCASSSHSVGKATGHT